MPIQIGPIEQSPANHMSYRPEIDGLRALAVLPVVLFHGGFTLFQGGFVGVDIFFVISGYLITSIIYTELAQDRFSLIQFYERRARRILPALFFVMFVTTIFAWLWLVPEEMRDYAQSLAAVSTFSSNFLFWRETGYFETSAELKPLLHTWTLAVEEQFYILFPLMLLLLWRVGPTLLTTTCLLLLVASLCLAHFGQSRAPQAAFFLLPTRFWELLVGAVIPLLGVPARISPLPRQVKEVASWIGLAGIGYAIFVFDELTPYPSFYTLIPTIGTALIICFAQPDTSVHRLLSKRVLVGLGLVSYSAYLWHQPLFAFAKYRELEAPTTGLMSLLILMSFVLAYFSWRYVEAPFRHKTKFNRRQVFSYSALVATFFIGFGVTGHLTNGTLWRTPPSHLHESFYQDLVAKPPNVGLQGELCNSLSSSSVCQLSEGSGAFILFVGDSHARDLSEAMRQYGIEADLNIWQLVDEGCGFFSQLSSQDSLCSESAAHLRKLIESGQVDQLLFVSHSAIHLRGIGSDETKIALDDIRSMLETAMANGVKVTLLNSRPILSVGLTTAAMANKLSQVSPLPLEHDSLVISEFEQPLEAGGATVIKQREYLRSLFCPNSDSCSYGFADQRPLYHDKHHLSGHGARLVVQQIIESGALASRN